MTLIASKTTMMTLFNLKILNLVNLFTQICFIFFLSISPLTFAHAEDIENLQKNASIAYERMIQAKQSAETLARDVAFTEKKLASIKQKLSAAEQEAEVARKKSEQARISMEQAVEGWKHATDVLANEWGKTERK
ncbi:MAG: hypothetical protein KA524_09455 [Nitrosomonas sp.]|nr:hypothetical protein [Nitrosomonas sp.]MBP6076570.1 hypothetical protein [Nitrosomonas sp.]